jgi:hypothetical protein
MSEQDLNSSSVADVDLDSWRTFITHRNKGRMKITFKLNQEEAAAFQSFQDATRPEGLSEEHFLKSIFFLGLTTLEQNVTRKLAESVSVEDNEVSFEVPEDVEAGDDQDSE